MNTLIRFEKVTAATFERPVELVLGGGSLYVVQQTGRVARLNADGATASIVLDLTTKVRSGGEAGLLGMALHPQFASNGFVYFYYTAEFAGPAPPNMAFESRLVRFHSNDGGLTLDPASEKIILRVDQPFTNHNGGTIGFGNDGLLYWGLGDGGSGGDPQGNAQKKTTLLGKMVRIDVDGGDPYAIPPTNPFASGAGGARPEIYALGLRNPYRWRFDPVTGVLWAGDVGQVEREEIDKIVLGGNYGWNIREGKICYVQLTCDGAGFIDPVVDHGRTEASSITGGVVYRGAGVPLLTGKYVYADFGLGTFFSIPIDDPAPKPMRLDEGLPRVNAAAFAIDKDGEIVFADYGGEIFRITAGGLTAPPEMPAKLSETGCVSAADPTKPASGLFPYDVNVAQWMDGATAERFLSVPAEGILRVGPEGQLALPPGAVAMKTLSAEGVRLETQLLLHRPDATWNAYTYVWNAEGTDANLAAGGSEVTLPSGRKHAVVDRAQCASCHVLDVIPTIGLEAAQLDRDDVDFGRGRLGNPLATLEKFAMLDTAVPRDTYVPLPREQGFQTAELRARGYLHANCASCHRGGGGAIDLRFGTPLRGTQTCDVPGTSKAGGRVRIAPRDPNESQLLRAMRATDPSQGRMPPVGSRVPDEAAIELVTSWISGIAACD